MSMIQEGTLKKENVDELALKVKKVISGIDLVQINKEKDEKKGKEGKTSIKEDEEKAKEGKKDDKKDEGKDGHLTLEKALDIYGTLDDVYKTNWQIPYYSMDPEFHMKVGQVFEHLRATKTYKDDNYFIDPMGWTAEKQLRSDGNDHREAIERAALHFDLKNM